MLSLLIETSTERGALAFLKGDEVIYQTYLPFGLNNSKYLIPSIHKGFQSLKLSCAQLSFIALGVGPGSYTGIRVAASAAKTLAYAHQLPLVSLCSLNGFIPDEDGFFAAIIDAKITGIYGLTGKKEGNSLRYTSEPQAIALEKAEAFLKMSDFLITPQSAQLRPKLDSLFPNNHWQWQESSPNISHLAQLAYEKYQHQDFSLNSHLELLYLRKTQAEIEREQNLRAIV